LLSIIKKLVRLGNTFNTLSNHTYQFSNKNDSKDNPAK